MDVVHPREKSYWIIDANTKILCLRSCFIEISFVANGKAQINFLRDHRDHFDNSFSSWFKT